MMFLTLSLIALILCIAFHIQKFSLIKLIYLLVILFLGFSLFVVYTKLKFIQSSSSSLQLNVILFDDDWQFSFDEQNWINISLPHTSQIEKQSKKTCFYRKQVTINNNSESYFLHFDGAIDETDVWVNDELAGRHIGIYLPFDIPLRTNRNRILNILVRLRRTDNSSQLYPGLYRHVWLIKKSTYFSFNQTIRIDYENVTKTQAILIVRFQIQTDSNSLDRCYIRFLLNDYEIYPLNISNFNRAIISMDNPRLWSPKEPNLYRFAIELLDIETQTIRYDRQSINIGIRSFEFHPSSSNLFINGDKFDYLVGINRIEEYPSIGSALSDSAHYRDAYKIKQAGFNLVRCVYHLPSIAFLNACDQLGLLVIQSILIDETSTEKIEDWFERDYNHPSIVHWEISIENDSMNKNVLLQTHELTKNMKSSWIDLENAAEAVLVSTQEKTYPANNRTILFIGEDKDRKENVSKIDEKVLLKQAIDIQHVHNYNRRSSQTTRIVGDANSFMFDYTSGIMNIYRLPNFAYYFYQSQCVSCSPMIFIANYWNDPLMTNVTIYTNCDHVELRLNGVLITNGGRDQSENSSHLLRPPFIFRIDRFTPGRLEAIGFVRNKAVIRTRRITTSKKTPHYLRIETDLSGKSLTTNDIVFLHVYIYDENNMLISDANDLIQFSLRSSHSQAQFIGENPVRAQNGIASILLKTNSTMSDSQLTVIAFSSTVKEQEKRVLIDICCDNKL